MQDSIKALANELTTALMAQIENSELRDKDRELAIAQLVDLQPESDELVTKLLDLVTPQASPVVINSIFNSLVKTKAKGMARLFTKMLLVMFGNALLLIVMAVFIN
jgi:GAF domain-containing protein